MYVYEVRTISESATFELCSDSMGGIRYLYELRTISETSTFELGSDTQSY